MTGGSVIDLHHHTSSSDPDAQTKNHQIGSGLSLINCRFTSSHMRSTADHLQPSHCPGWLLLWMACLQSACGRPHGLPAPSCQVSLNSIWLRHVIAQWFPSRSWFARHQQEGGADPSARAAWTCCWTSTATLRPSLAVYSSQFEFKLSLTAGSDKWITSGVWHWQNQMSLLGPVWHWQNQCHDYIWSLTLTNSNVTDNVK